MNTPRLYRTLIMLAAFVLCGCAGSADWPAFRQNALRTAAQLERSALSDPKKVAKLHVVWRFPNAIEADLCDGFRASPVVFKGRVFIGNGNGYFYALDAETGAKVWQYPPVTCPADECPPLKSKFICNKSSLGIASSATIAKIGGTDAVIFAAPDPSIGTHLGEGRLFALATRTGEVIWKSPVIARLNGCTPDCPTELHENLGHSSPLVLGDKVYVGIGDHCDNPVQKGRVAAVSLANGSLVDTFRYCSTHLDKNAADTCDPKDTTRGGGVWSPPAGWKDGLYVTTGNTHNGQKDEPGTNHGLSLLRLDPVTGAVAWKFQPVPWERDSDPDWSAAPTVMTASCGPVIISTQKDGWTHALNAADGKARWSFPEAELPFRCGDGTTHGDTKYMRSGAAWGDVYVTMNGGLNLALSDEDGYRRLHAFNVCASKPESPLRWLIDVVPSTAGCNAVDGAGRYCLGNPTITRGIVYVGTDQGHLVAIADPTVAPPVGLRCANPSIPNAICVKMGSFLVPQPKILAEVPLEGSMVYAEPVLANGKVYVSTDACDHGYVYMLQP